MYREGPQCRRSRQHGGTCIDNVCAEQKLSCFLNYPNQDVFPVKAGNTADADISQLTSCVMSLCFPICCRKSRWWELGVLRMRWLSSKFYVVLKMFLPCLWPRNNHTRAVGLLKKYKVRHLCWSLHLSSTRFCAANLQELCLKFGGCVGS